MTTQHTAPNRFASLPQSRALSIFLTAGYPRLNDTVPLIKALDKSGVAMIEIGFPFSDPIADGPTIQESNRVALSNGMTLSVLFTQLREVRAHTDIPLLLMGYLNPVEQYGFERFLADAAECGIDGVILPDMPFEQYLRNYRALFTTYGIRPAFLVTPRTSDGRIRAFDAENPAFLYLVSSDAVTGGAVSVSAERAQFFERVSQMGLTSPCFVGFGVRDKAGFESVTTHTQGAIIGSRFLQAIADLPASRATPGQSDFENTDTVKQFIVSIREG
jgi:tryptophan synthase alpha chain